jgi:hypothetical protein
MKVLVCGGRAFCDRLLVDRVLGELDIAVLISGGALGADSLAEDWARRNEVTRVIMPAKWKLHGKAAGPIRNRNMIKLMPDLVVAFPGGSGTRDMIKVAKEKGIEVRIVDENS